ncbi:abortive infection family protein [Sulfurimonas diazotrophicus]|uniref:Abortive infection family protein n=1 Tax=Sulfurimonas diazotrophicus TaxID=3131939 RepID=A0ABZ3HE85_9BACT
MENLLKFFESTQQLIQKQREALLHKVNTITGYELVSFAHDKFSDMAAGANRDDEIYTILRNRLVQNKSFEQHLPIWLKQNRDVRQFWDFIKNKFPTYEERRIFIKNEFLPLLDKLEFQTLAPIEETITFDEKHIHEYWIKAIERKGNDPEGAITMARTLIESVLKHILDEQDIEYDVNMDLSELYKKVQKHLNLAPEQHQEAIFKQILGGASGIINGLGTLRNKLGDAHGSTKTKVKPLERHGELAVNMAGSMAIFLYKTYTESKEDK